jgi:hypothetical protein
MADATPPPAQPPPSGVNGGINAGHMVAGASGGGIAAMLADVLVWATHWPLKPLDFATSTSFAGLIVAGIGVLLAMIKSKGSKTDG